MGSTAIRFFTRSDINMVTKLPVLFAVLYILSPFDIVPDWIPLVGWIEDIVIGILAYFYAQRVVNEATLVRQQRDESDTITVDAKVIDEETR